MRVCWLLGHALCWDIASTLTVHGVQGHIWTMVAGGGASVIYADTVGDLGLADELGNYAEYSGAPNAQASHQNTASYPAAQGIGQLKLKRFQCPTALLL